MSIEHMAAVLHHSRAKGTHKLVLLGIANHEGDGGSWPSVRTLATYANVTPRNVQKSIAWLVERGELRVWVQDGGNHRTAEHRRPNRYQVLVTCPTWCDRTPNHRDTRRGQAGEHVGLWIDPLSDSTPPVGFDTPPLSHATGGPLSHATPKPSLQPDPPPVETEPQYAREPCADCGQPEYHCQRRQARWTKADRHDYRSVSNAEG